LPKIKEPVRNTKLIKPAEGEQICVVKRLVGADHAIVVCVDGKERMGRIPGKMRKRVWLREGDVVLVAVWEFQQNKCDIVHKYGGDEIKKLIEEKVIDKDVLESLTKM